MQIVADFHQHSKYSRATSPKLDLITMATWADKKGIQIIGSGDWTHPLWFKEIETNLSEKTHGLFTLKNKPLSMKNEVYFILTTEISSIYTQGGKTRRVHNLVFSPSIQTCKQISQALIKRGCNIMSDGRPIIGLSSKELLELCLEIDPAIMFVPAHIWTPWFSLFGSKSGFNSIKECFEDLSSHIYAIETGLSSDPWMNWQISELDNKAIISSSDAHSGPKLGREATVFISKKKPIHELTYTDFSNALKNKPSSVILGYTIEFFPEEGKYHYSGHRLCNISLSPQEVKKNGIVCPKCKKPLTIGVEDRVAELASTLYSDKDLDIKENQYGMSFVIDKNHTKTPYVSLIPLAEILLHITGSPKTSENMYEKLVEGLGSEFDVLMKASLEEIASYSNTSVSYAISNLRKRNVKVVPGYDGVFGTISLPMYDENNSDSQQILFA